MPQLNQLHVGDGDSTVKVIDLAAKAIVAIISTGGMITNDLTMKVTNGYPVTCSPAGLALGPLQRVMTSCGASGSTLEITGITLETRTSVSLMLRGGHTLAVDSNRRHPVS